MVIIKRAITLKAVIRRAVVFLAFCSLPLCEAHGEAFRCFGTYSDVHEGEDWSGFVLKILSPSKIEAVYYEGNEVKMKIQNIIVEKQLLDFDTIIDGEKRHFYGSCQGNSLSYKWGSASGLLKRKF